MLSIAPVFLRTIFRKLPPITYKCTCLLMNSPEAAQTLRRSNRRATKVLLAKSGRFYSSDQMVIVKHDSNAGHFLSGMRAAFRERHHLLAHQKMHAGVRDHPCEFCHRAFFNRKSLLSHMRDVVVFYQCDLCSQRFNKPYKIRKYMDSAHKVQLTNVSQFKTIILESFNEDEVDSLLNTCDED